MANWQQELDALGRSIQQIVDQAVNSSDFQQLDRSIRQAVEQGTQAVRSVADSVSRPQPVKPVAEQKALPVLYGSAGKLVARGLAKVAGGGMLSLATLAWILPKAAAPGMPVYFAELLALTFFGLGVWLICGGVDALGMAGRFRVYRQLLGQKTYCSLDKLSRGVGKSVKFVRRELERMIGQGLFRQGHLDAEGNGLITSDETYAYFEQSRRQLQKTKEQSEQSAPTEKHPPQVREVLDRGNAFIAEIRRCNDAIPGEEISGKIDRMEYIVRRIFDRAEAHPEIIPDLKKLMDYYLPMTVKLLGAYADMDAQPIQGENITASKREIENTLDTLNLAFERLLDSVFADTALDISSDISVLNTLLAQEGLTGDGLDKTHK